MSWAVFFNLVTVVMLLAGMFFLFTGAMGVWRLPDLYHRMIAASKCVTLGITGMLIASVVHLAVLEPEPGAGDTTSASAVGMATKAMLVIAFQFVAGPLASYLLARAAHQDGVEQWQGTLSDDLAEDEASQR